MASGSNPHSAKPSLRVGRVDHCQDSSVLRFLRIDAMVSGSGPTSAKLSRRVGRINGSS